MKFIRDRGIYSKVKRDKWMKVITTKWLDVNKSDDANPNIRSRLVGRELKLDNRLDLFAATPPLEALRIICSLCASHQRQPRGRNFRMMSIDVRRAYFYARTIRPVYVEIPKEDWEPGDEDRVAQLHFSFYGTRDAAQNWIAEYTSYLVSIGFRPGAASTCSFWHKGRELYLSVHGDDFTITGPEDSLMWLEMQMKNKYEIKTEHLGPGAHQKQEIRVLNRTIRWSPDGIEYEPDQRHAEIIIKEMGVEGSKPSACPGAAETPEEARVMAASPEMASSDATAFRGLAARLNFLAQDSPILQFAAKKVSEKMARPREADWLKLTRAAKYLVGAPRLIQIFQWQELPHRLHTFTDSDWAGDRETRKSTSGGAVVYGLHTLKTWSSTQTVIALSSGEAELYALVKGAAQSFGIMEMLADFDIKANCTVCTDASAAIGMVHRQGLGKTRHIEVQYLWIQQAVAAGKLGVVKVGTDANPADLMTKHLRAEIASRHLEALHYYVSTGRAASAPSLLRCSSSRDESPPETILPVQREGIDKWRNRAEGIDKWRNRADAEIVEREHHKPRFALFTPMKVAKGPKSAADVGKWRITIGELANGQSFFLVDEWKKAANPHELLSQPWTGATLFARSLASPGMFTPLTRQGAAPRQPPPETIPPVQREGCGPRQNAPLLSRPSSRLSLCFLASAPEGPFLDWNPVLWQAPHASVRDAQAVWGCLHPHRIPSKFSRFMTWIT